MSPEQQRIKIAEACGWTDLIDSEFSPGIVMGRHKSQSRSNRTAVPDYVNNLNAMHEAEVQLMTADIWPRYLEHLLECSPMFTHHATAAQRSEAFLRTLGLWKA